MKLKYEFVVRDVGAARVAVTMGADNAKFNGMVKLNDTGAVIFDMLKTDTTEEEIVSALLKKYEVSEAEVTTAVASYLDSLRKNGLIEE